MKQRIDFVAMLLVLGSSSLAVAQQPPAAAPPAPEEAAPAEPAPDEAAPAAPPTEEPAAPSAPEQAEPSAPTPGEAAEAAPPAEAAPEAEAPPAEAPAPAAQGEGGEIVVTGSRIKRSAAFVASAPVQIIDRKQLEYSGATNLADVVQYLTVAQSSGFPGGYALGSSPGTVAINLRGLGVSNTLVLINGRRVAPSGGGIAAQYGDLGTIPLAAVERIEILKGGASSIYGSDAVGGVVNIITRKNFDGARVEIDGEGTTHSFDERDGTVSAALGAHSDKGRVMLSMQYTRNNELLDTQRDWTARSDTLVRASQGFPGSYVVGAGSMPDPDCTRAPGSQIDQASHLCVLNTRSFTSLIPAGERVNAFGSADYDLTNHTTLYSELLVSRSRGDQTFNTFPIAPAVRYGSGTGFPPVPASHVDNPFGVEADFIGRPFGLDAGPTYSNADDDTLRIVAGLKGDLEDAAADTIFESWEWDVYSTYSQDRYHSIINDTLQSEILNGLSACSDPAHLQNCYNPFYSSVLGTGTPNSDSVQAAIRGPLITQTDHSMQTYNAGMTGNLFELPGGDVGLAFGGELRHEWRQSINDHDATQTNFGLLLGDTNAVARRNVYSGYLELRWPFYDGIELQTAGRIEYYDDINKSAPSPSVGITITPSEIAGRDNVAPALRRLQIRGHATYAFRGPSLYNSFPGSVVLPAAIVDPKGGGLPSLVGIHYFGNQNLKPEYATAVSGGLAWSPIDELGLLGEFWFYNYKDRIKQENYSQILSNFFTERDAPGNMTCPADPHLITSGTSATCKVTAVNADTINTKGSLVTDGIDFGATINLTGATFGGDKEDFGTISFGAIGTYTLSYNIPYAEMLADAVKDGVKCDGTSPTSTCHLAGVRNSTAALPAIPRWRANFPVTWGFKGHHAAVITHFISSVVDDQAAANHPGVLWNLPVIGSFTTVDLQYSYTLKDFIGKELTMRLGVYNLLDSDPPYAEPGQIALSGFDPSLHDPRGRIVYAKLISQF